MKRLRFVNNWRFIIFLSLLTIGVGCNPTYTNSASSYVEEEGTLPAPAKELDEIIKNISDDDPAVRLVSIRALDQFGDEAVKAIPALRKALFDEWGEIQAIAAIQLGRFGPKAIDAVPELQTVLENDMSYNARYWAVRSLGEIGSPTSVPILAATLYDDNEFIEIDCAEAIAAITGIHFTDSGRQGGYILNDQGIPKIVIDAREWWQETGQYQDWK